MPYASAIGALHGRLIVITRPAGTAATFARQVRRHGGMPLLLPGLALRAVDEVEPAREQLRAALAQDAVVLFTSPAAVRFAAALVPLRTRASVLAVGQGTAAALRRQGLSAQVPSSRQDSEGLLELPLLQAMQGLGVALIGAADGRGLLQAQLAARGARVRDVWVYRRTPPRLDRRHVDAVLRLPAAACVLLSSGQALAHLHEGLPPTVWQHLCRATAVVSSERLAAAAAEAGFRRVQLAASAASGDLLAAAAQLGR